MISDKVVNLELFADDFERYEEYCKAHDLSLYNGLPFLLDSMNVPSADEIRADRKRADVKRWESEKLREMPAHVSLIRTKAEAGDSFAQAELADLYYSGKGVVQDYAQAFFWAEKAAADGIGSAELLLGLLYYSGRGITLDFEKAREIFCRLAETGEPLYQVYAGACSLVKKTEGERQEDKNRNEQVAVSWFEKAAKQRDSIGELMLGWCYAHGVGVKKDEERGKVLMSRAVIRGDTLPRNYEVILEGVLDTEK